MSMGYGSRAIQLLKDYYEFRVTNLNEDILPEEQHIEPIPDEDVGLLEETIEPRKSLPPLLLKLSERPPERLDYLGVSFGLTAPLLKFWKRENFVPVYMRQTTNELTGEHSCIMIHVLHADQPNVRTDWLREFWFDFRRRFLSLLSYQFRTFPTSLALSVAVNKSIEQPTTELTKQELDMLLTKYDMKRLEMYCNNLVDYHLIMDLLPVLARVYFLNQMGDMHLSAVLAAILLGLGLQHKTVEVLSAELDLPNTQLLALFNRCMRRIVQFLRRITEQSVEEKLLIQTSDVQTDKLNPLKQSMNKELEEAAKELKIKQQKELEKLKRENLSQYVIKGSEFEWNKALSSKGGKNIISVKSGEKRGLPVSESQPEEDRPDGNKKKKKKHKKSLLS